MKTLSKRTLDVWMQIGGDMDPGKHGAIIAKWDENGVEVREIQPVRSLIGDREAVDVGFPFWSNEAYYDKEDLDPLNPDTKAARDSFEIDDFGDKIALEHAIAEALLLYGYKTEEGPAGWAKDVTPDKVYWWGSRRARGWRYLEEEDVDFRQLVRKSA